jgi:hypothetical protein
LNGSALCDRPAHLNSADPSSVENGPGPIRPNADHACAQNRRSPLRQTTGAHGLLPPTFSPTCTAKGLPYLRTALACRAPHDTPLSCYEAATPRPTPALCSAECTMLSIPHCCLCPGFPAACLLTGTHRIMPSTVTAPTVHPHPQSHPTYVAWPTPTAPLVPSAPIISYHAHKLSPPHACATLLSSLKARREGQHHFPTPTTITPRLLLACA